MKPRRAYFVDLVQCVRSARAAMRRREPALAIRHLVAAAYEVGFARSWFGPCAVTERLSRSIRRMETIVALTLEHEPSDTSVAIALAIMRTLDVPRKPPQRAPLRLVPADEAAS